MLARERWLIIHMEQFGTLVMTIFFFFTSAPSQSVLPIALLIVVVCYLLYVNNQVIANHSDTLVSVFHCNYTDPQLQVSCMRSLSAEDIVIEQDFNASTTAFWSPVIDGFTILKDPILSVKNGEAFSGDLLLGTNTNEGKYHKFHVDNVLVLVLMYSGTVRVVHTSRPLSKGLRSYQASQ